MAASTDQTPSLPATFAFIALTSFIAVGFIGRKSHPPHYDDRPNNDRHLRCNFTDFGTMYFRARYYDANTGEFISRDPLEYVDGMSLYRGYFAPGMVDPSGTIWRPTVVTSQVPKNSANPNLGIELQTVFTKIGNCGAVHWQTRWLKKLPLNKGGSFILQEFDYLVIVKDCDGKEKKRTHYHGWEAWPVPTKTKKKNGYIFVGFDNFTVSTAGNCTTGTLELKATYTEIFGKIPVGKMPKGGAHPPSGVNQHSTFTDPKITPHATPRKHELVGHWDCCGKNCKKDPCYDPKVDPEL